MTMIRVENRRSAQPVDLQPYGNTISVEALSDNPFEDAQDVEVVTQYSGGMSGPDPKMRSRAIMTRPPREQLHMAGRVKATQTVAPAHLQHRSFIPGLGALAAAAKAPRPAPNLMRRSFMPGLGADPVMGPPAPATTDWAGTAANLATQAASAYQADAARKVADANARAAAANAAAQNAQLERQRLLSAVIPNAGNMAAHAGISGTALAIGGAAIVAAVFLFMKKRK